MDFPEDTLFITICTIYDGWSIAKTPDGVYHNRWEPGTQRHKAVETYIKKFCKKDDKK